MPNFTDLHVGGIIPVTSNALVNNLQVATGQGQLYYWSIGNSDGTNAGLYLLIDSASGSVPVNGTVKPLDWMYVAATSSGTTTTARLYSPYPILFQNGLWICASSTLTTPFTLTSQTTTKTSIMALVATN